MEIIASLLNLGTPATVLLVAGLLVVAARTSWLRNQVLVLGALLPAAMLAAVAAVAAPFWRLAAPIAHLLLAMLPLDKLWLAWLDGTRLADHPNALLRGDRLTTAQAVWPEATYPDLYRQVPEDIARPPFDDGRLIGGHRLSWLADRHLTGEALRSACRVGVTAALLLFGTLVALYVLSYGRDVVSLFTGAAAQARIVETWPAPVSAPVGWWAGELGHRLWGGVANLPAVLPSAALFGVGTGMLVMLLLLRRWQQEKAEPYELATKDSDVRWAFRAETRQLMRRVYAHQVVHATEHLKDAPAYAVGTATGVLRTRGDLTAPTPGQAMKIDQEALFQHLLVFGGTGEGKTTALLKPLLRQLMPMLHVGFYICDAKGVLWQDGLRLARATGRGKDVIVLGTGEGQHGMDVLAGLSATQVASALRSVMAQMSPGDSGDTFFPDMAANIFRNVLSLAHAYALTPGGQRSAAAGLHPYSLMWCYQTALSAQAQADVIAELRATYEEKRAALLAADDDAQVPRLQAELKPFSSKELHGSIAYVETTWATMADSTRSGIVANLTQFFDGFVGSETLRDRFACGPVAGGIAIEAALQGKVVLNALSSIEDGLPARLVSILVKTNLYRAARVRERRLRREAKGTRPQDQPCIVVMDEVQELVTADPTSGLSDATFWNVARSTGLAGIFATQTVAALQQAIGEHAAANFMQQARSKVFFRTEDRTTVDYACWCAGSGERNRVYEDCQRESLDYRVLLDGWNPLAPVDEQESIQGGAGVFAGAAGAMLSSGASAIGQAGTRPTYRPDVPDAAGTAAPPRPQRDAAWRAEDKALDYRKSGNEVRALLDQHDLLNMGRWHAYAHIQRAGALRQDLIAVEHDFD